MKTITNILNSEYKACMYITGGGAGAINSLLENGGGSKFLLDAQVPYSKTALETLLQQNINKAVCEETSRLMSETAYMSAFNLGANKSLGIGCTAKLTYEGERPGREHIAYLSLTKDGLTKCYNFKISETIPGLSRKEQEYMLSIFIIAYIWKFINEN